MIMPLLNTPSVEEFAWAYYVYVRSRQLDPWLYITVRVRTSQQVDSVHHRRRKPVLPKTKMVFHQHYDRWLPWP